jgi:O-antigen/teichoic acid export membrane protein
MGKVQFVQWVVTDLTIAYFALRLLPGFRLHPSGGSRWAYRILFGFGWKASFQSVALMLQSQIEWLLVVRLLGVGPVALYSFGSKIPEVVRQIVLPAFSGAMAAASAVGASEGMERLRQLYSRASLMANAATFGIGLCLVVIAPLFITAWIGPGYGSSILAMRLLSIAACMALSVGMISAVARGLGVMKPAMIATFVLAVVELGAGLALGTAFGLPGLLAGTLLAFTSYALVSIVLQHRALGWPVWPALLRFYAMPFVLASAAALPLLWWNHLHRAAIMTIGHGRFRVVQLGSAIALETIAYFALYGLAIWATRYLTGDDIRSLRSALSGARTAHRVTEMPAET